MVMMKRDKLGRFIGGKAPKGKANTKKPAAKPVDLTTNLIMVIDQSSSMMGHQQDVINEVQRQKTIHRGHLTNTSSVILFDNRVHQPQFIDLGFSYNPTGMTALNDAIFRAANTIFSPNIPTIILIITDGEENASVTTRSYVLDAVKNLPKNVTITIIGPETVKKYASSIGIPPGNVQVWDPHTSFANVSHSINVGTQNYYATRSLGGVSTQSFYANVDPAQVQNNLQQSTTKYDIWPVLKDCRIDDLVNERLKKHGQFYQKGRGFYQLSKSEEVQPNKQVVVMSKDGTIYDGVYARRAIGIPDSTRVKLRPGQMNGYDVFVQSTSDSRKLIAGTKVLYR